MNLIAPALKPAFDYTRQMKTNRTKPTPTKPRKTAQHPLASQPLQLLGGLSPAQFFAEYWHKKPLLIRQAIPNFQPPILPDELFSLAADRDVESRLIRQQRKQWRLEHGPFEPAHLPPLRQPNWTLLVQGVNLHHSATAELLQQFRFIPDTRLDDLMVSFATKGGGVGPHFDSYDVFLLQAIGQRHWKISAQENLDLVDGMPLKILRNFQPEQDWVLEPGDMLYLPPHIAHDGTALGNCMTYSIGFRAPEYQELGLAFLEYLTDTLELSGRYSDPERQPSQHPAWIDDALLDQVTHALKKIRWDKKIVTEFLGEYLSSPKFITYFTPPKQPYSATRFTQLAQKKEIYLDPKTRMLYRSPQLFMNGESFVTSGADARFLQKFANQRHQKLPADASLELRETLYAWYCAGWLELV